MAVELRLKEPLSIKEVNKFKIPNTLTLSNFDGYQYAMCLCGIKKDRHDKYVYDPRFSRNYIDTKITPNEIMSFAELHKSIVFKEKQIDNGRVVTVFYITYTRDDKPSLFNDFYLFEKNKVTIEIVMCNGDLYRPLDLHLELSPWTPMVNAVHSLFSNENLEVLKCITKTDYSDYLVEFYDEYGKTRMINYSNMESIFASIISMRIISAQRV